MAKKVSGLKIRSVIVAEDIRQELHGKQSIIGMFAGNIVSSEPVLRMPKITFRIEFMINEERDLAIFFSVVAPSGLIVFSNDSPLTLHAKADSPCVAVIGWGPAVFKEKGLYSIRLGIDAPAEEEIGNIDVILPDLVQHKETKSSLPIAK